MELNKDMEKSREMARLAVEALSDKKAEDVRVLDISEVSVLADFFIIASGKNIRQIAALSESVEEKLGEKGYLPKNIEGKSGASWLLMDFGEIIIHIFDEENRMFYDLERIWKDGKPVEL